MTYNIELFLSLVEKRGQFCEVCGIRPANELHHCLYHRNKKHPEFDAPENLMLICHQCHQEGKVNSWDFRVMFWKKQEQRGYNMQEWNESLNIKVKQMFVAPLPKEHTMEEK